MIHPVVAYYRETAGGPLQKQSFCFLSGVNSHNTTMVVSILKSLLLTELRPLIHRLNIGQVYYITDSPVSQYRNKFIFYIISNHQLIFGMPAVWNYFEKGHGKGPCDGVGGADKRDAAQAAKHGVPMADVFQFRDWAMQKESGIQFCFITQVEYDHTSVDVTLIEKRLLPVHNTLTLHSIRSGQRIGEVEWRGTTCNCVGCLTRDSSCEYHCVSVVRPKRKGRKEEGNLFTACDRCTETVLCLCFHNFATPSSSGVSADASSESLTEGEEDVQYVPVTEEEEEDSGEDSGADTDTMIVQPLPRRSKRKH